MSSIYIEEALALHRDRKLDEAKQCYFAYLELHPDAAFVWNNLGNIYHAHKEFQHAVHCYYEAIDHQPDYPEAYYNLGLALLKLDRYEEAISAFDALLQLNACHMGAQFQLGRIYLQLKNITKAWNYFSELHEAHPTHPETLVNLGTCYLEMGKLYEAHAYYLQALELLPTDLQLLFNLGVLNMQQGRIKEAINYYAQTLKVDANFFPGHNNIAAAYLALRDTKLALLHFREALRLKPDNMALKHTIKVLSERHEIHTTPPEYIQSLFDSYAGHYDAHMIESLSYRLPDDIQQLLSQMCLAPHSLSILDLGCGTGLMGTILKPYTNRLSGVDLSSAMLEKARQKSCYDELFEMDALAFISDKAHSYDMVIAADLFVYMGDLTAILARIHAALKSGGYVIFNTEMTTQANFTVTSSGRFKHQKIYLDEILSTQGWRECAYRSVILRTQDNEPVYGHLYFLQKL